MQKAGGWDRHIAGLTGSVVSGGAILAIGENPAPPKNRPSVIYAQKGISMRAPEANALVDAIMDGKVHRDYVHVGGQQYMITTVTEAGNYGMCTSSATAGGIVLVKTRRVLIVATYTEPTPAAAAIAHVHGFADTLEL